MYVVSRRADNNSSSPDGARGIGGFSFGRSISGVGGGVGGVGGVGGSGGGAGSSSSRNGKRTCYDTANQIQPDSTRLAVRAVFLLRKLIA